MLTAAEFNVLRNNVGQPLMWYQAKDPQAAQLVDRAILQNTKRESEAIINSYGLNGSSIQVAVDDLPVEPEKFDVFVDTNGLRFVVDLVVKHHARLTGVLVSFTCYCKGK